jgi:exopolysaccharide/PEP-CTERM locus tyrosine autokinase
MNKISKVKGIYKAESAAGSRPITHSEIGRMGEVDRFSVEELDQLKIISGSMQNSKILNIFRELRTQLLNTNKKKNFVCMVSSISQGGGASYVASNLAAVFALDKTKTSLLIDANLYDPGLDKLIIGDSESGITDYLSDGSLDIKDVVYATGVPRLRVIPIGGNREAAAEYFSSDKMHSFVEEIRERYSDRFVFIDSPPILDSSEARILSEIVDVVLLVVGHGGVTQEQVESAIEIIDKDKLAGLVYNN